eukprot:1156355-Pelagomonas_calceolata.AAC.3
MTSRVHGACAGAGNDEACTGEGADGKRGAWCMCWCRHRKKHAQVNMLKMGAMHGHPVSKSRWMSAMFLVCIALRTQAWGAGKLFMSSKRAG